MLFFQKGISDALLEKQLAGKQPIGKHPCDIVASSYKKMLEISI